MYAPVPREAAIPVPDLAPSWSWAGGRALAVLTVLLVGLGISPTPVPRDDEDDGGEHTLTAGEEGLGTWSRGTCLLRQQPKPCQCKRARCMSHPCCTCSAIPSAASRKPRIWPYCRSTRWAFATFCRSRAAAWIRCANCDSTATARGVCRSSSSAVATAAWAVYASNAAAVGGPPGSSTAARQVWASCSACRSMAASCSHSWR
jgi:hypothetical protein